MKNNKGFSLFELLIGLLIVGILGAIALPFYSQHVAHEKRLEAAMMLSKLAVALEQYYTMHNTYKDASLATLGFSDKIANNCYALKIASATDSDFNLEAQPLADQADKDTICGTLTLNSLGIKSMSGSGKLTDCW